MRMLYVFDDNDDAELPFLTVVLKL